MQTSRWKTSKCFTEYLEIELRNKRDFQQKLYKVTKYRKDNFYNYDLIILKYQILLQNNMEHAVARMVEALRYTTGIFHSHNLSFRTVCLQSTQPLTEMCTGSILWRVNPADAYI